MRTSFVGTASSIVAARSSTAWLYLLRQVYIVNLMRVAGVDGDVARNMLLIAENLVGASTSIRDDRLLTKESSRDVARLLGRAWLIERSEQIARSVNKGMLLVSDHEDILRTAGPRNLQEAIGEFDFRQRWHSSAPWEPELQRSSRIHVQGMPTAVMALRWRQEDLPSAFRSAMVLRHSNFLLRVFEAAAPWHDLIDGVTLAAMQKPRNYVALLIVGNTMLRLAQRKKYLQWSTLKKFGFLRLRRQILLGLLTVTLRDAPIREWLRRNRLEQFSAEEVIALVCGLYRPGVTNYPGRVLVEQNDALTVDLASLAWHLSLELRIDPKVGGALANEGASRFEQTVQGLVDGSVLAPPATLRELRGRTLRFAGKQITDIDAMASTSGKLILISCKRFGVGVDYIAGDYRAVRNMESRANRAIEDWSKVIAFFRRNKKGDNYDFTGFEIDGIVVAPELVLSTDQRSREFVELGIRALAFTRLESVGQFAAILEMAGGSSRSTSR